MERHINTYQGLNKDAGRDTLPNSLYIDAKDIRISTDRGESIGSWTNIKGNTEFFNIPINNTLVAGGNNFGAWTATNPEIIGYTTIRNRIIIFVADDSDSKGWVYDVQYNPATRVITGGFPALKYYNPNFNFRKSHPIKALGHFETENIQKVYWTDYNNFFRSLNLEEPNLPTFPLGQVDIFPDVTFNSPQLSLITSGGALPNGELLVAYKLLTFDGKETLVSPPSNLIHITASSETLNQSADYVGSINPVNTGKSVSITVDTSLYGDFDKIEFVVAHYPSYNAVPEVKTIEQISINNQPSITFVYTGNEGTDFPIELLEFTSKNYSFKTCKSLTQKDNSLVIANIKGSSVNIQDLLEPLETFSAKTYRYNSLGVINPDEFNQEFNKDAHWDPDWHTNSQFKFRSNGTTLGGEGPNISFKFHLEQFTLDGNNPTPAFTNVTDTPDSPGHDLNDGYGVRNNTTYPNFASPFISGLLRGYKRGETYRFGFVGNTTKGESSFVEYIADIKFPDISDINDEVTVNIDGTDYYYYPLAVLDGSNTIGCALGISFEIDFTSCPSLQTKLETYQIVRVQREEGDRRRISQGTIKTFWRNPVAGAHPDFDLRVESSSNTLHLFPQAGATGEVSGCFNTLVDHDVDPSPISPSVSIADIDGASIEDDYIIKGNFVGLYTPEISYNFGGVRENAAAISNNPCMLLTGAYHRGYARVQFGADINLSGINLGLTGQDFRSTCKATYPISVTDPIHAVKQWSDAKFMNMNTGDTYEGEVTGAIVDGSNTYYMRNYYAIDKYDDPAAHLNDPQGGGGSGSSVPALYRGGTSIIGKIIQPVNDPLTATPITPPLGYVDYFNSPEFINVIHPTTFVANTAWHATSMPIIDVMLPKAEVYGGYGQDALESNIFIQASPVIPINELNPKVFGGDIFLNMFTLQTGQCGLEEPFYGNSKYNKNISSTEAFPVESLLNLDLDAGSTIKRGVQYTYDGLTLELLRQEDSNSNSSGTKAESTIMYTYNKVYSTENKNVTYFVKPVNSTENSNVNDVRAYLSNVKINGESIDSWTKFGSNNYYDVDDYGPINEILNWRDTVFFFQDKAHGTYAINRAAITTTNDGVPTQLGTGKGFGKHQYLSKEHGTIHQWGIKATNKGIYMFDAIHRKLFLITGDSNPISEINGLHSLFNQLPNGIFLRKENGGDNPIKGKGITIGKDVINDEIIFTFLDKETVKTYELSTFYPQGSIILLGSIMYYALLPFSTTASGIESLELLNANCSVATQDQVYNSTSVVYDELVGQFSSFYSARPTLWIDNGDILISANSLFSRKVYTHNTGNWGEFYGKIEEASVSLVINPNADINKILRLLEFNSTVRDNSKVVDRDVTITAFRVQTEYQDTGKILFDSNRIKRRFDKWRVKISRDTLSTNQRARMRSTHFIVTLYFDNTENKEFIMNRLMSYYDVQMF
jgi:hypothetical protein